MRNCLNIHWILFGWEKSSHSQASEQTNKHILQRYDFICPQKDQKNSIFDASVRKIKMQTIAWLWKFELLIFFCQLFRLFAKQKYNTHHHDLSKMHTHSHLKKNKKWCIPKKKKNETISRNTTTVSLWRFVFLLFVYNSPERNDERRG